MPSTFRRNLPALGMAILVGSGVDPAPAANIALLYALDKDGQAFAAAAGVAPVAMACGDRRLQRFGLGPHTIIMVKMGSGGTETAVSATCALTRISCDLVISLGPAGALKDNLPPGTVVLIDRLHPWQTSQDAVIPLKIPVLTAVAGTAPQKPEWQVPGLGKVPGVVCASGELFIQSSTQRRELAAQAAIVDMNTLGAETAAAAWKVPCLHLRVISDLANESARPDFLTFTRTYDGRLGTAAFQLIQSLPPDPARPESYDALRRLIPQTLESPAPPAAPPAPPVSPK